MSRTIPFRLLALAVAVLAPSALASSGLAPADPSPHRVADPDAPPVTAANVLASERFWPYRVALTRDWQAHPGGAPIRSGSRGVLIRCETAELARIDFGRQGLAEVPIAATDLVASANRVRLGEVEKTAPNFVHAIGPRLLDAGASPPAPVLLREAAEQRLFLTVFADVNGPGFETLAASLAGLQDRPGLMTVILHQGETPDGLVYDRLRLLGWRVPFVLDHLSEPYTRTLLSAGMAMPAVSVHTPEGRLVFESTWREDLLPQLGSALVTAGISAPGVSAPPRD